MRKSTIAGAAIMASFALAGTAQASNSANPIMMTTFDGFATTSVNGQDGWKSLGNYDQSVIDVAGNKMLRISNARTQSSFGDMTFSKPVVKAAGENEATNVLTNEFTIKAPDTYVPGLTVSVSPDDGNGGRMSYLRFEDKADGVHVIFEDSSFVPQEIAVLTREDAHKIRFETTLIHGHDNDVVRVSIDGTEVKRGGSWENYYRADEERNPSAIDRLIIRTAGTPAPATLGSGFLFDNVSSESSHVDNPAPLNPPAPGPAGPKGDTGATGAQGSAGANGVNGTTTSITQSASASKLIGARIRTLHVRSHKGMKLVSVRGSLRNKHLPVHGQSITVDLRGKVVGNYNVLITAKYRTKGGKIHTVRSTRSLSITLR
jgi:hypothetical protein